MISFWDAADNFTHARDKSTFDDDSALIKILGQVFRSLCRYADSRIGKTVRIGPPCSAFMRANEITTWTWRGRCQRLFYKAYAEDYYVNASTVYSDVIEFCCQSFKNFSLPHQMSEQYIVRAHLPFTHRKHPPSYSSVGANCCTIAILLNMDGSLAVNILSETASQSMKRNLARGYRHHSLGSRALPLGLPDHKSTLLQAR